MPKSLLVLPETIARIIKLSRQRNHVEQDIHNYFVIDALRHPFEVRYLRERISPFHLVAVTTEDSHRKTRLHTLNLRSDEIQNLDEKEYPAEAKDRPKGYAGFVSQDIQACLALADVYIRNLGDSKRVDLRETTRQICKYVASMQHPGLVTPTHVERCMQTAFSAKVNSGCISRQVGAVVTDTDFSIKAIGWNDVPKGQTPCLLRNAQHLLRHRNEKSYSDYELSNEKFRTAISDSDVGQTGEETVDGRNCAYCFRDAYNSITGAKNQVHTRSLHAEENAFMQIAKYGGHEIAGGYLFSTASPCELCAKKLGRQT